MAVIAFALAQAKETHIVLGRMLSKEIGAVIKTHQTIYLAANGSAKEANQWNNMTPIPKPTIQQSVAALSSRDEFKVIIQFIQDERERFFGDLRQCSETNDVMKIVGSISTLDELLILLRKEDWHSLKLFYSSLAVLFSAFRLCVEAPRGIPSRGFLLGLHRNY